MNDATFMWELPTTRESGNPLPVEEIAFVEIALSADGGANFSVLGNIAPPTVDLVQADLVDGDYYARAVVVDTNGERSPENVIPFAVDTSAPSAVVNFGVTLS